MLSEEYCFSRLLCSNWHFKASAKSRHNRAINATSGLSHFVYKIEFREAHSRVIANSLGVHDIYKESKLQI